MSKWMVNMLKAMLDVCHLLCYNYSINVTFQRNVFHHPQLQPGEPLQKRHCWQTPHAALESLSKAETRVGASGLPSNQSTRRTRLIAVAMARCCTCVFGNPTERERRRSKARTPCEMVASTPARRAYLCWKVSVRWSLRAAWSAACCAMPV